MVASTNESDWPSLDGYSSDESDDRNRFPNMCIDCEELFDMDMSNGINGDCDRLYDLYFGVEGYDDGDRCIGCLVDFLNQARRKKRGKKLNSRDFESNKTTKDDEDDPEVELLELAKKYEAGGNNCVWCMVNEINSGRSVEESLECDTHIGGYMDVALVGGRPMRTQSSKHLKRFPCRTCYSAWWSDIVESRYQLIIARYIADRNMPNSPLCSSKLPDDIIRAIILYI